MSVIHVNSDEEFHSIKHLFGPPFVIDFYADWCAPCKMISPIFEELSNEVNATFIKVNVDNCTFQTKYNIRGIPTIIIVADFEQDPVHTIVGVKTKQIMKEQITIAVEKITDAH